MTKRINVKHLQQMKANAEKIACLTCYDASFARMQENAGVDVLLVGDSLGMVLQNEPNTLTVSMTDILYHTQLVYKGSCQALIISDMPFMSYTSSAQGVGNAGRLISAGAQMVKLEGGNHIAETVAAIVQHGIPVCGHLGLTPQSIHQLGGHHIQANNPKTAQQLIDNAQYLVQAGISCLILECVPAKLGKKVSQLLDVPVIGIGAGRDCDGQVLVNYDILGLTEQKTKFSKNFIQAKDSISAAFEDYVQSVKNRTFPAIENQYAQDY